MGVQVGGEELEAARRALVPHEHRLGTSGLVPDELVRLVLEAAVPGLRRRLEAELTAGTEGPEGRARAAEEELGAVRAGAGRATEALQARGRELEELVRELEGLVAARTVERDRYREALSRIGDGRSGAQLIAWEALGRKRT